MTAKLLLLRETNTTLPSVVLILPSVIVFLSFQSPLCTCSPCLPRSAGAHQDAVQGRLLQGR